MDFSVEMLPSQFSKIVLEG